MFNLMFTALSVLLLILGCGMHVHANEFCPPAEVFPDDCFCDPYEKAVNCYLHTIDGGQVFDVKQRLNELNQYMVQSKKSAALFNEFMLVCLSPAYNITLADNAFHGLELKRIVIDKCNVDYVDRSALKSSAKSASYVSMKNNMIKPDQIGNLFAALDSLTMVEAIDLSSNNIDHVPRDAFKNNNKFYLNELDLQNNQIVDIGVDAFDRLQSLNYLYLDNNLLTKLSANIFDFDKFSTKQLIISLNSNNLTSDSFDAEMFTKMNRPLHLDMNDNHIVYLDETIFKPFLFKTKMNQLSLIHNEVDCTHPANHWLATFEPLLNHLNKLTVDGHVWSCFFGKSYQRN